MQRRFPWQHKDVYGKIQKEKKCEGPESKDLTWKIVEDIWGGQCGSKAGRPVGDRKCCPGVMNKGNRIKGGEPEGSSSVPQPGCRLRSAVALLLQALPTQFHFSLLLSRQASQGQR